jgi:molybdopterin synthase catalytic subunit
MKRWLEISKNPIDIVALTQTQDQSVTSGAVVCFSGVVRGMEDGKPIAAIEYEAFGEMAVHQFHQLFDQMSKRWPIESVRLVHRLGRVAAGEASLWVEIQSGHRGEALESCGWLIDEMKRVVPIWKKPLVH